jgi:hypothetical protein
MRHKFQVRGEEVITPTDVLIANILGYGWLCFFIFLLGLIAYLSAGIEEGVEYEHRKYLERLENTGKK